MQSVCSHGEEGVPFSQKQDSLLATTAVVVGASSASMAVEHSLRTPRLQKGADWAEGLLKFHALDL